MSRTTRKRVLELLGAHHTMAFATNRRDGYPQATTVVYANDGLSLYFACDRSSQKVKNLGRSKKVALVIDDGDAAEWNDVKGLSIGGKAEVLRDRTQIARAKRALEKRFPEMGNLFADDAETGTAFVKVSPEVISIIDYSQGFGHTDLVRARLSRRRRSG